MNVPYEAVCPAVDNVLFHLDLNVREQTRTTEGFESVLKMQTDCSGRGFSTADRKFSKRKVDPQGSNNICLA